MERNFLMGKNSYKVNHKNYVTFLGSTSIIWSTSVMIHFCNPIHFCNLILSNDFIIFQRSCMCIILATWIYRSLREKFTNTGHNRPPNKYESKFICYWHTCTIYIYLTFLLQRSSVPVSKLHIIMFWNKTLNTTLEADSLMQHFCDTLLLVHNE